LDYKWVETASWRTACRISCLSWNLEGTRLLTGGSVLQLWHQQLPDEIIEGNTGIYDLFITIFIIKNNLFKVNKPFIFTQFVRNNFYYYL